MTRAGEQLLLVIGLAYLCVLSWAMTSLSFDIWGAMVTGPLLLLIGMLLVRRMFRGDLAHLQRILWFGLAVKLLGAIVRYWVAFDAYGGSTDAERYHQFAKDAAGKVWAGETQFTSVLPAGTSTEFIERFTAFVYTVMGSSKLGAFLFFSWMAYFGLAFFVRAATLAIPGLAAKRYAGWCVLAPTLVYWPSSIGKEAWMLLWLGLATYGIASLLATNRFVRPLLVAGVGLACSAFVRPHIAGIWIAGLLPALLVAVFRRQRGRTSDMGLGLKRLGLVIAIGIAGVALSVVASTTVKYLNPDGDEAEVDSTSITEILNETTRRTSESGSTFRPPNVSSPLDWPTAAARTLTRPLLIEARGTAQLLTALEVTVFMMCCLGAYRRLLHLPKLVFTNPYVAFAMTSLFLGGLAYSSFANLGVLARQRSLVFPFLVLLPCLPPLPVRGVGLDAPSSESTPTPAVA